MAKWNVGDKNGMWTGGRTVASNGYVLIRVGKDHHLADTRGYAYEHRLVAELKIGRRLRQGEIVHHKNGKKADNADSNIEVLKTIAHHRQEHRSKNSNRRLIGQINKFVLCICGCGKAFLKYDKSGRPRKFVSGHN
jgi:hypothetical protein